MNFIEKHLFAIAKTIAHKASKELGFPVREIRVFRPEDNYRLANYGTCDLTTNIIDINLFTPGTTEYVTTEELIDTVLHEVAHLRHPTHGRAFKKCLQELHDWINAEYIKR